MNLPDLQAHNIFFRKYTITGEEIRKSFMQPMFYLYVVAVAVIFLLIDNKGVQVQTSYLSLTLIWMVAISLQILIFVLLCVAYSWLQDWYKLPSLYLPIISVMAFLVNFPVSVYHASYHAGIPTYEAYNAKIFWSALILSLIFETLYFVFVYPLLHPRKIPAPEVQVRHLNIAGQAFDIAEVITLQGQEHYVIVTTANGTQKLRGRLGDLVSQTDEKDGILAHRSHWVSRTAIREITVENGTEFIVTNSGERMSIARPRQEKVREWMQKYVVETV